MQRISYTPKSREKKSKVGYGTVGQKRTYIDSCADLHGWLDPGAGILLEDGRKYDIDEVKDKCRAASLKAGGCGLRYTIRIGARDTYLFDEDGRWFVELRTG